MQDAVTLTDIYAAHERIAGVARRTSLLQVPQHPHIFLKLESEQPIGSFKLRGAYNLVAGLTPEELSRGVITFSSGNHAQGVAYAAKERGAKAVIVMPYSAPLVKREATKALGAEIVLVGPSSKERFDKASELVKEHGYVMVPPYDHPAIIAGQATCGLEIVEQMPQVDLVLSPVSGGGLLSGVATAVKLSAEAGLAKKTVQVWGCEPEVAGDAAESFAARELREWPAERTTSTIADGLRTQSLGRLNFEHILRHVDGIVTVTEDEILEALRIILTTTSVVAEPSGAVTLATALFHAKQLPAAETIVAIVSGGNIDPALKARLQAGA